MTYNKPLTVYKASAGSGKTFTLAIEYISLLIANPKSYENILAVTFTNKATEEMKMRILSQLYGISHRLPDSSNYMRMVMEKTGKSETEVVRNADMALSSLIHNYRCFRVQTIDAFFQGILRNLARELDLTANLRIDLNDEKIEEQAVEDLVESLETGDKVLDWIREYIDANMREELNWNVIGEIKKFGNNIFRDFYKKNSKELDILMKDEVFFSTYVKELRSIRERAKNEVSGKAKEIISILEDHSLNNYDYISYGNRGSVLSHINKVADGNFNGDEPSKRVSDCKSEPEKWAKKKTGKEKELVKLADDCLCEKLRLMEETRVRCWKNYQSATLTLKHLNQLRLLHAIAETVDEINRSNNRFQLSNTHTLLNSLVRGSDSPFIFEKAGVLLKHIMIDEFQDTSTIQWENFKVLLDNCIAQSGSHNLIVGDVKQSIYRWRSGDWKLLNNIGDEFHEEQMSILSLDTNYRSERNVVEFNNVFFEEITKATIDELTKDNIEGWEQLAKAYSSDGLRQKTNKKDRKGHVRIELFPASEYRENIMHNLILTVVDMLEKGIREKDIAILVRSNPDIQSIAERFMKERPDIKIVSDEAFRLDSSSAVNIIINALRMLVSPGDKLAKANLAKVYDKLIGHRSLSDNEMFLSGKLDNFLPKGFVCEAETLIAMPLSDLVDRIYMLFGLSSLQEQSAYVCAFHDRLDDYLRDNPSDIEAFLKEWDENLHEKTIVSDETDGIRLISIHKSKGLEFDNVIIPLCDWQLERVNTIWCGKKDVCPYNKLPIVPVDFSRNSMKGTVYENDYKEEHLQNTVDNLNLLYVAFTRAGKNLVVTGKRMSENKKSGKSGTTTSVNRSEIMEKAMENVAKNLEGSILEGLDDFKSPLRFEYGSLVVPDTHTENKVSRSRNVFTLPSVAHRMKIETFSNPVEFRQSNKSKEFVKDEDDSPTLSYVKIGNLLHKLFSSIRTIEDIAPMLKELEFEGVIYDDTVTYDDIRSRLSTALADTRVREWFSDKWKLYNECTILTKDDEGNVKEYRPDRVMSGDRQTIVVDFKFGKPREEHASQVLNYMNLLSGMGHPSVKGYVWYVLQDEIKEVN